MFFKVVLLVCLATAVLGADHGHRRKTTTPDPLSTPKHIKPILIADVALEADAALGLAARRRTDSPRYPRTTTTGPLLPPKPIKAALEADVAPEADAAALGLAARRRTDSPRYPRTTTLGPLLPPKPIKAALEADVALEANAAVGLAARRRTDFPRYPRTTTAGPLLPPKPIKPVLGANAALEADVALEADAALGVDLIRSRRAAVTNPTSSPEAIRGFPGVRLPKSFRPRRKTTPRPTSTKSPVQVEWIEPHKPAIRKARSPDDGVAVNIKHDDKSGTSGSVSANKNVWSSSDGNTNVDVNGSASKNFDHGNSDAQVGVSLTHKFD